MLWVVLSNPKNGFIQILRRFYRTHRKSGPEKGVITKKGLFTGGISRISKTSKFSRISRKWSTSPLLATVSGFSTISRKLTSLQRPLFQKTPFSEPSERFYQTQTWSPKRLYRTPMNGSSEPQTGFYRTFRLFRLPLLKLCLIGGWGWSSIY